MYVPAVRFNIRHLMMMVAVTAGVAALIRMPLMGELVAAAVLVFIPTSIAFSLPFLFVSPGRRLWAATWITSMWPLSSLLWLHLPWLLAYAILGRPLGPADHGVLIGIYEAAVLISLPISLISTSVSFALPIGILVEGKVDWMALIIPITVVPLVLFACKVVVDWDPYGAVTESSVTKETVSITGAGFWHGG